MSRDTSSGAPSAEGPRRVITDEVPFTAIEVQVRVGGATALSRAHAVLSRGPFVEWQVFGDQAMALVPGREVPYYKVTLNADLRGHCECPHFRSGRTTFCKHLAAAAMTWIREGSGDTAAARSSATASGPIHQVEQERPREARRRPDSAIRVCSFEVRSTYRCLYEGSVERTTEVILASLRRSYPVDEPNTGYAVIVPRLDGGGLPRWRCEACLESSEPLRDGDDGSGLFLCWFVHRIDRPITDLVASAVAQIDWRTRAQSFSWVDLRRTSDELGEL